MRAVLEKSSTGQLRSLIFLRDDLRVPDPSYGDDSAVRHFHGYHVTQNLQLIGGLNALSSTRRERSLLGGGQEDARCKDWRNLL